jgi:pilus assembly protein FimV
MIVRDASLRAIARSSVCRFAVAAAVAFVLSGVTGGATGAQAATADAASVPGAASAPLAAGSQYAIHPGQSLNDAAIAATQSHDRATLARASKALFDANPSAFMSHDPSRLRLGSVLTIPALDATGAAVVASDAAGASAASGAGVSPAVAASSPSATASSATSPATAATASAVVGAAPQTAIGQANGASAAAQAAPAVAGPASVPVQAGPATPGAAAASAPSASSEAAAVASGAVSGAASAPAEVSSTAAIAPGASRASGAHVWTGAIQPASGASVGGASAALPAMPSAGAPVVEAPTQVSSLQQLLALKSRVLMELQQHGIGGKPAQPSQAGSAATAASIQPAAASGSHGQSTGAMASSPAQVGNFDLTPENLGFAAAIGAAAVALLAALGMRRRKRGVTSAEAPGASETEAVPGPETVVARDNVAPDEAIDAPDPAIADEYSAREVAEREAAAREEATARELAEREAAQQAAEQEAAAHTAAEHEAAAQKAADSETAAHDTAEREDPATPRAATEPPLEVQARSSWSENPQVPEPTRFEDTAAAAGLAAAAELGADALPSTQFDPAAGHPSHTAPADPQQWTEPTGDRSDETSAEEPRERHEPPHPQIDFGAPAPLGEPQAESPFGQPRTEPSLDHTLAPHALPTPPQLEPEWGEPLAPQAFEPAPHEEPLAPEAFQPAPHEASPAHRQSDAPHVADSEFPTEQPSTDTPAEAAAGSFPRDAVDAFGSLDMGLPPRTEPLTPASPASPAIPPASLSTQPVVEPEVTAHQALPLAAAEPLPAAEEIAAGTAGRAAVAGLGAAGFGALNLDFDLELPPSPAQPLPSFTPQDMVRIARNKLDLASEYIELGDLAGARALIQEVIDTNDAASRSDARALLSTLRPLS